MPKHLAVQLAGGIFDTGFNWADALTTGESIVGSEWTQHFGSIIANLTGSQVDDLPGASFDADQTKVWFKGGNPGETSRLENRIITNASREINDAITINVLRLLHPGYEIPGSRVFRLIPTEMAGLRGEAEKSFPVGLATTIGIDFVNDLPIYGRLANVHSVEILDGFANGVVFDSSNVLATMAKVKMVPHLKGSYTVRVKATYADPTADPDTGIGDVVIHVF